MDNTKTLLAAALAAIAITTWAAPGSHGSEPSGRRGRPQQEVVRPASQPTVRRGAFAPPNDPFHDTYKKNTGEIRREAPKSVRNVRAKVSAARAADLKLELERERAYRSPISCWSNCGASPTVAAAPAAVAEQKAITILNSTVTINQ